MIKLKAMTTESIFKLIDTNPRKTAQVPCVIRAMEIVEKMLKNDACLIRLFQPLVNSFCEVNVGEYIWCPDVKRQLGLNYIKTRQKVILVDMEANFHHFMEASDEDNTIHINLNYASDCELNNSIESARSVYFMVVKLLHEIADLLTQTLNTLRLKLHYQQQEGGGKGRRIRHNVVGDWTTPTQIGTMFIKEEQAQEEGSVGGKKRKKATIEWVTRGDCGSGWEDKLLGGRVTLEQRSGGSSFFAKTLLVVEPPRDVTGGRQGSFFDIPDCIVEAFQACWNQEKFSTNNNANELTELLLATKATLKKTLDRAPNSSLPSVLEALNEKGHSPILCNVLEITSEDLKDIEAGKYKI